MNVYVAIPDFVILIGITVIVLRLWCTRKHLK